MKRRMENVVSIISSDAPPSKSKLEKQLGKETIIGGYVVIPKRILKQYRGLKMTPTELTLWATIMQFQFEDQCPWVGIQRIADEMEKSRRTIERYIKRLEEKELLF